MPAGAQRNLDFNYCWSCLAPLTPCFTCRTFLHRKDRFFAWCSIISQTHRQTEGQASFATRVTPFKSHQQVWLSLGVSFWQGQAVIRPGSDKNVAFEYFWILSGENGYSVHWKLVLALQSCGNKCFLRQQSRCGTVHLTALNEVLLPEKGRPSNISSFPCHILVPICIAIIKDIVCPKTYRTGPKRFYQISHHYCGVLDLLNVNTSSCISTKFDGWNSNDIFHDRLYKHG